MSIRVGILALLLVGACGGGGGDGGGGDGAALADARGADGGGLPDGVGPGPDGGGGTLDGATPGPDARRLPDAPPPADAGPPDAPPPDARDYCLPDPCNGRATSCDPSTGVCSCGGHFAGGACEICAPGWTGAACDACAPGYTGATCATCDSGYARVGSLCLDDSCDPDPCNGHATSCDASSGAAICACAGHFTGPTCAVCQTGYAGADCASCATGTYEHPAGSGVCVDDPCLPDPCNGHGTCSNATGAAVCTCSSHWAAPTCAACQPGYTGTDCETNIEDCAARPCKNAGTCADGVAAYTCTCKGAWDGPTCETIYYGDSALANAARAADVNACSDESLLDLTDWLPDPNTAYTDPSMSSTCTASQWTITSNSVPQYKVQWTGGRTSFANTLTPTTSSYVIPRTTVFNTTPKQATVVGGIGVAINGVQLSTPSASGGPLQYADPAGTEVDGDTCDGHPNPSGKYHYHSLKTSCFYPQADDGDLKGDPCTAPSPIIAWIADGYPMYGPCECLDADCTSVVEMRSSWQLAGGDGNPDDCAYQDYSYAGSPTGEESDGDAILDECNGHYGPKGDYHYHSTNEYPWTLRCYRGNPTATMTGGRTYSNTAGGSDCCFNKQCIAGEYQESVTCMTMSCVP